MFSTELFSHNSSIEDDLLDVESHGDVEPEMSVKKLIESEFDLSISWKFDKFSF